MTVDVDDYKRQRIVEGFKRDGSGWGRIVKEMDRLACRA
jgi:hypothetical protein